jgi:hypothetical protein
MNRGNTIWPGIRAQVGRAPLLAGLASIPCLSTFYLLLLLCLLSPHRPCSLSPARLLPSPRSLFAPTIYRSPVSSLPTFLFPPAPAPPPRAHP